MRRGWGRKQMRLFPPKLWSEDNSSARNNVVTVVLISGWQSWICFCFFKMILHNVFCYCENRHFSHVTVFIGHYRTLRFNSESARSPTVEPWWSHILVFQLILPFIFIFSANLFFVVVVAFLTNHSLLLPHVVHPHPWLSSFVNDRTWSLNQLPQILAKPWASPGSVEGHVRFGSSRWRHVNVRAAICAHQLEGRQHTREWKRLKLKKRGEDNDWITITVLHLVCVCECVCLCELNSFTFFF